LPDAFTPTTGDVLVNAVYPEITLAEPSDLPRLFEVWEASVRATHLFLTEENIQTFIPLVKEELASFSPLHCLRDSGGQVFAFIGVAGAKIEMLFVAPEHQRHGAGRKLVEYAVSVLGADAVDVNEQNERAVWFYERMGFRRVSRSAVDSLGYPFPILQLRRAGATIIETARLRLQLRSREELLALFDGHPEVSPEWLARIRNSTTPDPWTYGFAVIERESGTDVGHAGFKGPPDNAGMVEIAYGINPEHQRRGYATEAAEGMVMFAFGDQRVRLVRAHAKPENVPSNRVLEKCGFRRIGQVIDPDDGLVERWEREA
jgi:putative acetyltransferase